MSPIIVRYNQYEIKLLNPIKSSVKVFTFSILVEYKTNRDRTFLKTLITPIILTYFYLSASFTQPIAIVNF